MPPKGKLFKARRKKALSMAPKLPTPPPLLSEEEYLSFAPEAAATDPTPQSATATAATEEPFNPQPPPPPPIDSLLALEGGSSGLIVSAAPTPESEPRRSIRCRSKSGKRRTMKSKNTRYLKKVAGKKLKLKYSPFHSTPYPRPLYNTFVRDMGNAIRSNVPMLASTYNKLTADKKAPLMDYLEVLSERNKKNRTKNPNQINHRSGAKPISHWAEDFQKDNHPAPWVSAVIHGIENCPSAKEKVESLKRRLDELPKGQEEDGVEASQAEPISLEQQTAIIIDCLGERRGTGVRGMGMAGTRPAKKRGGHELPKQNCRGRTWRTAPSSSRKSCSRPGKKQNWPIPVLKRLIPGQKRLIPVSLHWRRQ